MVKGSGGRQISDQGRGIPPRPVATATQTSSNTLGSGHRHLSASIGIWLCLIVSFLHPTRGVCSPAANLVEQSFWWYRHYRHFWGIYIYILKEQWLPSLPSHQGRPQNRHNKLVQACPFCIDLPVLVTKGREIDSEWPPACDAGGRH